MSHMTTIETEFRDEECLLKALKDLGVEDVQKHSTPHQLEGYMGDLREQKAHLVVSREQVNKHLSGGSSNDFGFLLKDGKYQAVVSEYDKSRWWNAKHGLLTQRYNYHKVFKEAKRQHKTISETKLKDGTIKLSIA